MAPGVDTTAKLAAVGAAELGGQLVSAADWKPDPTPWGPVAAVLLCLLPILFLLAVSVLRPLAMRSSRSLPLSAALLGLVRLAYLSSPPLLVLSHAAVGALEGLIPLAVIYGAVLLFEVMAVTGCLQFMMAGVRCLSAGSPIAEVFLIGWAFAYTISGVGGFSTPMALSAPMLVSLGHDPLMSLVTVVGLNGLAAHLGSVGMAIWFGFQSLNLGHAAILQIGLKSAVIVGACAFVIAPAAASFLVSWRELACNAGFVLLSVASAVVPTVLASLFSPEFPVVAGGLVSMLVTYLAVKYGIGRRPHCTLHTPADIETGNGTSRHFRLQLTAQPKQPGSVTAAAATGAVASSRPQLIACKAPDTPGLAAAVAAAAAAAAGLVPAASRASGTEQVLAAGSEAVAAAAAGTLSDAASAGGQHTPIVVEAHSGASLSTVASSEGEGNNSTAQADCSGGHRGNRGSDTAQQPAGAAHNRSSGGSTVNRPHTAAAAVPSRAPDTHLVSPFEVYSSLPLTEQLFGSDSSAHDEPLAPFASSMRLRTVRTDTSAAAARHSGEGETAAATATPAAAAQADVVTRRHQSLVAAAAAVGALAAAAAAPGASGAATGPGCIFRCPSCAADEQDIIAAEAAAALTRQLSAPAAAVRAAAAAAAIAAQGGLSSSRPGTAASAKGHQRHSSSGGGADAGVNVQVLPAPEPHHHQQLLPALSVVNHATGEHIIISGLDKVSGALRLLLHPGQMITTHGQLAALEQRPAGAEDTCSPEAPALPLLHSLPVEPVHWLEGVLRTLPIWLTLLLLLVTHVHVLRLQDLLRSPSPSFSLHLGTLGTLSLSPALVLRLQSLFMFPTANFTAELLYIPCLIPFVVVSGVSLVLFRSDVRKAGVSWRQPFAAAWRKLSGTVCPMLGALVLAQLMTAGGRGSPAFIIAFYLTSWMGKGYLAIAGFLGALGSFVSGSVMGSNMTQGAIQAVAADRLGLSVTSLLAVQVAGACAGKMVCISSILSAKVVLSELHGVSESKVIRCIGPLALVYVLLAQVLSLVWTLGGLWPDATS